MNANQLRNKHKRERRNKSKRMVITTIQFILVSVMLTGLINLMLDAWVEEIDNHAEYNKQYIQQLEDSRRDR